jgi:serine/threonine-protein kinase
LKATGVALASIVKSLDLDTLLQGTPFRAVARLGAGGMGEIYEAAGPFGGPPVVVKVLRAELADHAELVERLLREGEILQLLAHPNIVVAHGHGTTAAGRPYVVLERLTGSTLRQELVRRRAFPVGEAVAYGRQLLAALGAVHEAGIVHRDVKPGNVMLCPIGHKTRIKLFDFGVAKVEGDARRSVAPMACPTREGLCLGTPRYVSPEQISGVGVDRRTDIYAAGMLLYTMLAGRGPFDDIVGVEGLLEAHLAKEAPPPSSFMSAPLEPRIEAVILRAIAKDPAQRFADAATFSRELGRAWGKARGSRRDAGVRRIAVPAPYAHRPTHRCRMFALADPGPRVGYGATPRPAAELTREVLPTGTADEPITVVWSSALAAFGPASPGITGAFRTPISRRGVFCSAAAFFAVAGGLAMWFVR